MYPIILNEGCGGLKEVERHESTPILLQAKVPTNNIYFIIFVGLCLSEAGKLMTVETAYPGTLVIVTMCPEMEYELSRVRVSLGLQPLRVELSKPRFMACYKDKVYVGDLGE